MGSELGGRLVLIWMGQNDVTKPETESAAQLEIITIDVQFCENRLEYKSS